MFENKYLYNMLLEKTMKITFYINIAYIVLYTSEYFSMFEWENFLQREYSKIYNRKKKVLYIVINKREIS